MSENKKRSDMASTFKEEKKNVIRDLQTYVVSSFSRKNNGTPK